MVLSAAHTLSNLPPQPASYQPASHPSTIIYLLTTHHRSWQLPGEVSGLTLEATPIATSRGLVTAAPATEEENAVAAATDDAVEGEQVAVENQTLLFSVPKGSKHLLAVRVVLDIASASNLSQKDSAAAAAGWSPAFSLLPGLALGAVSRSFRAGGYDLGVNIAPVDTAARERTKVVTFVQRFWLTNKLTIAIEVEQWTTPPGQLEQPLVPLAAGERAPFHWPHAKEPDRLLRIRAVPGQGR